MLLKEACLENFTDVAKVITNGAKRLELCDNLGVGGTTVSKGVLAETCLYAHTKDIPVIALIRPRGGDYVYNDIEVKIMEADIFEAQALGVDGISIGALTKDNKLDIEVLDQLIAASGGMQLVLHMAFDELDFAEQKKAIDWAVDRGFERILTHGGPLSLPITDTLAHLKELIAYAAGRITILPGGGITAQNCEQIAQELGVNQLHGSKIV